MKTCELYDLNETLAKPLLEKTLYPWEALPKIGAFILALGETLPAEEYERRDGNIWISKTAKLYPNVFIEGPCIIGHRTEIRPGAFLRGNLLVGDDAVVGNSTELKNVILFNCVQVPHYNYVGDSILGHLAHMGAGAVTSNFKQDKTPVCVKTGTGSIETGLRKFGAMLGDGVEIGCGAVLNPGTVVGRRSRVYPLTMVRGCIEADRICKQDGRMVPIE